VTQQALPSVSICIPTYNQTDYLRMTLDSVFNQEGVDFEVIVSDDSSTDDVFHLIQTYEQNGHVINYYRNNPNLGSPENWNFAIQQAKGEYVKIMHHDDRFTSTKSLRSFVDLIEEDADNFLVFSGSKVTEFKGNSWVNKIDTAIFYQIMQDPSFLLRANLIGSPSAVMFKNEKLKLFDNKLKWLVDLEFYYRYIRLGKKFSFTPETLVETFLPENRITNICSNNASVEVPEHLYFIEKHTIRSYKNLNHIVELFIRLDSASTRKIRKTGFTGNINWRLKLLLLTKRSIFYNLYSITLKKIRNL
jgi:glycosyltransferase involved in cell wall biosynthesis